MLDFQPAIGNWSCHVIMSVWSTLIRLQRPLTTKRPCVVLEAAMVEAGSMWQLLKRTNANTSRTIYMLSFLFMRDCDSLITFIHVVSFQDFLWQGRVIRTICAEQMVGSQEFLGARRCHLGILRLSATLWLWDRAWRTWRTRRTFCMLSIVELWDQVIIRKLSGSSRWFQIVLPARCKRCHWIAIPRRFSGSWLRGSAAENAGAAGSSGSSSKAGWIRFHGLTGPSGWRWRDSTD